VTESTIARTKKKTEYNAQSQAMLEQKNFGIEQYIDNLIALTGHKKGVHTKKGIEFIPEGTVRFNAVSEIGEIFGTKAPKQVDLKHSMAAMGDDELVEEINKSVQEINQDGRIQRKITGSLNAGALITTSIACEESTVDIGTGEQATCPANS
jgi:hypothetical protein